MHAPGLGEEESPDPDRTKEEDVLMALQEIQGEDRIQKGCGPFVKEQ